MTITRFLYDCDPGADAALAMLFPLGGRDALERHRKVNRHRSKMLRAAFAYAVCRRAISFHICMASVVSSR
ncbi:hypothetical protein HFC70_13820 [Agrobacterium sp. a22-2]|uniref:hypothetical protein n=1 Tax=Agrobacterium sp. a22-2 TaxID=2283840 RepID=UPI001447926B|nr:hypothetical protein [Agrobacterium sp. a22-2]NKN37431.1 hypothetical protein [Agrobacterium sp. a22-2]